MSLETFKFQYSLLDSKMSLSTENKSLMDQAIIARENAYAPYSNFHVGAAVLLENGTTVLGNNQENAAYPSGLCAERVAIFYAAANYPGVVIKAVAISANAILSPLEKPAAPCGNCRQAMAEYEQKQVTPIAVMFMGASGQVIHCDSVLHLLPFAFGATFL